MRGSGEFGADAPLAPEEFLIPRTCAEFIDQLRVSLFRLGIRFFLASLDVTAVTDSIRAIGYTSSHR
jgi:hypothetical protein